MTTAPFTGLLFRPGRIVITPGVEDLLWESDVSADRVMRTLLKRHVFGDWGDVPPEDAKENEFSVENGYRILSSYKIAGEKVWVITEADRSSTTILLPSEY